MALNTITQELRYADTDISPIDRTWFLDNFSFDTPENIIVAMEFIYSSFPPLELNRIFFSLLHDAVSIKERFDNLFKTSYVSLSGQQKLPVPEL